MPRAESTTGWSLLDGIGGFAEGCGVEEEEESVGWATRPEGDWMTVERRGVCAAVEDNLRSRLTDLSLLISAESR